MDKKERAVFISGCHAKAKAILKSRHEDEYRAILHEIYESNGFSIRVYKPRTNNAAFDAAAKEQAMNALKDMRDKGLE